MRRCSLLAFVLGRLLLAQSEVGELRLTVRDAAGDAVPATVELINQATQTRETIVLPEDGRFSFRNLPFGVYRLSITQPGFATWSALLDLRSAVPQTRDVTMGIQPLESTVNVTESDTLLDPQQTGNARYIGAQQVKERPGGLAGRGVIDLVTTEPGWTLEANGVLHPRESEYDTQFVVDGFPVYDNRSPAFAPAVEVDNIESMKAYTGGIPAEFGQKLGGVIEINTQRNTSPGFHGVAVLEGGSFDTASGFVSTQYSQGRTTAEMSAQGFLTDRYLDPPVTENYTNHASSSAVSGALDRDWTDFDRIRISLDRRANRLQVPDDLLQAAAGQRQDRTSGDTEGRASYQHVFSGSLVGSLRGMVRNVEAELWSNPLSTPVATSQDRNYREGYIKAGLAGHKGRHEWKTGVEARYASIHEQFAYSIQSYEVMGLPAIDPGYPPQYSFRGHALDREQAGFAQDTVTLGNVTLSGGVRFDHYSLLVDRSGWSPRAAAAWHVPSLGLVLHFSYDRTFGTPPFENILVSAAGSTAALTGGFYLPIEPSRGNYYEGGFTKAFAKHLRLDASYFRRDLRNFEDDDLLLNTGVSFPIAYRSATVKGVETKLEVPKWGRFSEYVSYTNTIGTAQYPIAGGLFLDNGAATLLSSTGRFPISQDQRNTARGWVRYQIRPRLWTAWTASYNSGLPVEGADELPDASLLALQYGPRIVSAVNFDRARVRPNFSLDASAGVELWRQEKRSVNLQADVTNVTNRLNLINFAGLLSGTAVAPPRGIGIRLRTEF